MDTKTNLFTPIQLNSAVQLNHRIVMAPLTRFRSPGHVPNEMNLLYYDQRSRVPGTLIITEGAFVSPQGGGYQDVPGLYTEQQLSAWRLIFEKIHQNKSQVFVQLWALGRSADKKYIESTGNDYIAPSAIKAYGTTVEYIRETAKIMEYNKRNPLKKLSLPKPPIQDAPRALLEYEILKFINDYALAARAAINAGADGVEIHGTNFYLPEQFLYEGSNNRTDKWGNSIENRSRFILAIVDAVTAEIGAEKTALRLSPWVNFAKPKRGQSPIPQWSYLVSELEKRAQNGNRLAYLHLIEPRGIAGADPRAKFNSAATNDVFAEMWSGVLIRAGGFNRATAVKETQKDPRLLIALGRNFIANPDIVTRWKYDLDLNEYDRGTFYSSGPEGYTDYPFYDEKVTSSKL